MIYGGVDNRIGASIRPVGERLPVRGGYSSRDMGQRGGRGGALRGRGGGRGGRGRENRRRGGTKSRGPIVSANAMNGEPLTTEEQAYVDSVEMGSKRAAPVGETDRVSLEKEIPSLPTNTAPIGLVGAIRSSFITLSGQHGNERLSSEEHARRYLHGNGTYFVDEKDKANATGPGRVKWAPNEYDILDEDERETILQTLTAGQYQPLEPASIGNNPLPVIATYARRNETYLPKNAQTLAARIQRMLPQEKAAARPTQTAQQSEASV